MRPSLYSLFEALVILLLSIFLCEFGYYYLVFHYSCPTWLTIDRELPDANSTKILVLSDTHIMGAIKSVRIDKLLREWQMKQAYSIINSIYKPEVVIFLGDLLDEASFSSDENFKIASRDFSNIFPDTKNQERIIIAGNHDVGFHDQIRFNPYHLQRFHKKYSAAVNIQLIRSATLKSVNIVAINSMSFYNDTCPVCSLAIGATNKLSSYLEDSRNETMPEYSEPILLTHVPLFRPDDTHCDYPHRLKEKVQKRNIEGEDVMHEAASRFILERIKPRLVLAGHTHMRCTTEHEISDGSTQTVKELTISSFNQKYAEKTPGFLLLRANSTHLSYHYCTLIEEWVVATIYIATILVVCLRLIKCNAKRSESQLSLNVDNEQVEE